MKNIVKKISVLFLMVVLVASMSGNALAVSRPIHLRPLAAPITADPNADVIVWKYRFNTVTGIPEHRRWNETRGYWVDPYWIPMV